MCACALMRIAACGRNFLYLFTRTLFLCVLCVLCVLCLCLCFVLLCCVVFVCVVLCVFCCVVLCCVVLCCVVYVCVCLIEYNASAGRFAHHSSWIRLQGDPFEFSHVEQRVDFMEGSVKV